MKIDKLLNNKCEIEFNCTHSVDDPCVYFTGKKECRYKKHSNCNSVIARVGKLTRVLKDTIECDIEFIKKTRE